MNHSEQAPHRDGGTKKIRKTLQLCRQVYEALCQSLAGLGDDVLLDVSVESVVPAPDSSRMLVTLILADRTLMSVHDVYEALERASGTLRADVASAITRKRAPELTFVLHRSGEVRT